jgi:dephospho-CoA kinase
MRIIAITGGIGSGKSTVVNRLRKFGYPVVDADKIAHDIIKKGTVIYNNIINKFGYAIINHKTGQIDRKKLGKIVFADSKSRNLLQKLTHPVIIRQIKRLLQKYKNTGYAAVILDAPLLFEAKLTGLVDSVVVVWVPEHVQSARLVKRDNLTQQQARARIKSQIPLIIKKKSADFVIDNSGPVSGINKKIHFLHELLTKKN